MPRDRELLARVSRMNLGHVVIGLLDVIHDDTAYAARLRELAGSLADLTAAVYSRADELDGGNDNRPMVIDSAV